MSSTRVRYRATPFSYDVPDTTAPWGRGSGTYVGHAGFYEARGNGTRPSLRGYSALIQERMTDVITPRFKEIVKKGEFRPINPMSKVLTENPMAIVDVSYSLVSVLRKALYENNKYVCSGAFNSYRVAIPVPSPGTLADETDINAMLLDAKASLKGAGMDYLTTAAEYRETLGMFLNMKQNLLYRRDRVVAAWSKDLQQKRRTGKFKGFHSLKEGWEAFSNFWLEYRFGWRILAYDIQAIRDYYKRKNDGVKLFTRRTTRSFSDSSYTLHSSSPIGASGLGHFELWKQVESTETVRVGYSAFVNQAVLGNPIVLNTLYDITPWTLVVDMFFNVQDNIIALSKFPVGVSEVSDSGFISSKKQTTVTIFGKHVGATVGMHEADIRVEPQSVGMSQSYTRSKIGEPSFDISFQPNLDLGKIIDLATLAMPIFRTIRKNL